MFARAPFPAAARPEPPQVRAGLPRLQSKREPVSTLSPAPTCGGRARGSGEGGSRKHPRSSMKTEEMTKRGAPGNDHRWVHAGRGRAEPRAVVFRVKDHPRRKRLDWTTHAVGDPLSRGRTPGAAWRQWVLSWRTGNPGCCCGSRECCCCATRREGTRHRCSTTHRDSHGCRCRHLPRSACGASRGERNPRDGPDHRA